MRKFIFTLSVVNAFLNALVVALFMPSEVIVLYGLNGHAAHYGSRWFYLFLLALPLFISGGMLLHSKLSGSSKKKETSECGEEPISPIDEMFSGNSVHSDNWGLVITWFTAIMSWVFTGIALNDIDDISIIMPSIVVIMLSAAVIFFSSFYKEVAPTAIAGVRFPWLAKDEEVRERTNRISFYLGVMGGFAGVCLAAWSLIVSSIIPNCAAIMVLLMFAFIIPTVYSYIISKQTKTKK